MDSTPTPSEKPTCEHGEKEAHTYTCVWQYGSGVQDVHDWCPGPVIATEPETPVPEVTCKCATADCSHYGGIDCEACGCKTPASDPTPELRERIEALTWALTALGTEEFVRPGPPIVVLRKMRDELDAVLSALGEPK